MYFNDVTQTNQTLSSGKGGCTSAKTLVVVVILVCDIELRFGIIGMLLPIAVIEDVCMHMVVIEDVVTLAFVAAWLVLPTVFWPDLLLHAIMLQIRFSVKPVHSCKLNSK